MTRRQNYFQHKQFSSLKRFLIDKCKLLVTKEDNFISRQHVQSSRQSSRHKFQSFGQVPYIFSKSKSQDTKIKFQKIPDATRPKEDKILSAQIQRMVSRQVQKRFLTSFKVTNSDKIPDKFTFGKSRQISSDKIPDKFTFRQKIQTNSFRFPQDFTFQVTKTTV
jgi:hypothetical protein